MRGLRGDRRLGDVPWHDLVGLSPRQVLVEILLPVPWLVASACLLHAGQALAGAVACFFFFLTGLRLAHGAQHGSLGIPRRAHDVVLAILSVLMVSSLHALQATHLHHHRHALQPGDFESATARMPWWRAVLTGPWFVLALNREGYRLAKPGRRAWIRLEACLIVAYLAAVFAGGPASLQRFAGAMAIGECLTGFFAVWTVHHDCDPERELARTQRGWWKTALTYQMFFHLEHHLFPAVPTARLPELAARLDVRLPHLRDRQVF